MAYSDEINKHLSDEKLMSPDTWKAPFSLRLESIWRQAALLLVSIPGVIVILLSFLPAVASAVEVGILLGMTAVLLAMFAWACYWYGKVMFQPRYTVKHVEVTFHDAEYYVEPEIMGAFIQEVISQWDEAGIVPFKASELLHGSHLLLQAHRPKDPLKRVADDRVIGLTYGGKKRSIVYAPYALTHGGAGYELRLQMCHVLHPEHTEEDDIEWMTRHDLI